ncbi:type I methionyl aminopeptidase [Stenotrophomonas sp. CFBP 13718]|uniref:type I methionyl aminopeptidase n=1 Tax=Stenotrophomonas sp. CFBP 13718 TaxID=2775304 RepID=UPI00177B4C5C|nr:type I methionyl aminopeptidase [Stenotrophomonas sp. CFBP 13718]MBD8696355.1 type I methionyl aminopeptidase [Stenotrophomonas sp. CFBP 13718]
MIKSAQEIALMATSGALLAQVFDRLDRLSLEGRSTMELNDLVERMIVDDLQARPASKGQYDFPFVLNASIDDIVCHGMPSADDVLRSGQIVNLDITLEKNGYIADSSTTYLVGEVAYPARRLVRATYLAMWKGIAAVRPGAHTGDIGHAIARFAREMGYSVVKEYCGHGIGTEMHEEPQILHYGHAGTGVELEEGMVFTIEPMLNQGKAAIRHRPDAWPVHTRDGRLSAQFEHTVAVTREGVQVLTLRQGESAPA